MCFNEVKLTLFSVGGCVPERADLRAAPDGATPLSCQQYTAHHSMGHHTTAGKIKKIVNNTQITTAWDSIQQQVR